MDNKQGLGKRVEVKVVDSHDEMMLSLMIRSAVYVGEDGRLLMEEVDGNDLNSTHVIARVDGVPAGTLRIRYFGGFAIIERLAVLKPYRLKRFNCRGVAWELGVYAFEFCRLKGYTRFYGLARDGLVDFWRRFAPAGCSFEPIPGVIVPYGEMLAYPMEGTAPLLPHAITDTRDFETLKARESALPDLLAAIAEAARTDMPTGGDLQQLA